MHRMEKAPLIDASDDPRMVGESSSAGARAASIDRSVLSVFGGRRVASAAEERRVVWEVRAGEGTKDAGREVRRVGG